MIDTSDVRYSTIPGFPDCYKVGTDGSVWSCRKIIPGKGRCGNRSTIDYESWKQLKTSSTGKYFVVTIIIETGQKGITKSVHSLILQAFVGPRPHGLQCRHLNGNAFDNRLENLCWGTAAENGEDMRRHGNHAYGVRNRGSKLSEEQVTEIRRLHKSGASCRELEDKFGVGKSTIHRIIKRTHWTRID